MGWGTGTGKKHEKKEAKDKCSGGKCKRGFMCVKHSKGAVTGKDFELYDAQGRNRNTLRWDGSEF